MNYAHSSPICRYHSQYPSHPRARVFTACSSHMALSQDTFDHLVVLVINSRWYLMNFYILVVQPQSLKKSFFLLLLLGISTSENPSHSCSLLKAMKKNASTLSPWRRSFHPCVSLLEQVICLAQDLPRKKYIASKSFGYPTRISSTKIIWPLNLAPKKTGHFLNLPHLFA